MIFIILLKFSFILNVYCDPESIQDNFEYYKHGVNEDMFTNLDLELPRFQPMYRPREVKGWPQQSLNVGQITAVSINSRNQPVIFHRAQRIFDGNSFNSSNVYKHRGKGPIREETILVLDPHTGSILDSWGENSFYMPHGLTVDHHDNVWVTDVAMHQVFKYVPHRKTPSLTIGEAFTAGYSNKWRVLLCMPTAVAIATTGEIFVADGYCNNQVLKFNAAGGLLRVIPTYAEHLPLNIPHGLTLIEHLDLICVADRENKRIVCPNAGVKNSLGMYDPPKVIQEPYLGRVYDVASRGSMLYAVNGPTSDALQIRGFTINPSNGNVLDSWEPATGFTNPHSLAVTENGDYMYVTEIGPNKIWKFTLYEEEVGK